MLHDANILHKLQNELNIVVPVGMRVLPKLQLNLD